MTDNSIPEQAVDARKAATEEVERLLQHPEDLKRLPNMLEEYTQKHQANKMQLSATVASQVDAARAGMELLDSAQKTLAKMQECYKDIDVLCTECSNLIDNHEKIQVLSAVHYNLGKTLQDVENIVNLPQEAADAERMLQDDTQLLQAYECLAILEGTSSMAQQALESNAKLKRDDSRNISAYFNKVKATMSKVEERLWSIIRNFATLGKEQPAMLVNAVRIIELQEMVDKQLEASGKSGTRAIQPKRYRKRCEQQIGMSIQDNFAPLLRDCAQLMAAGENTDKRTGEILDEAHEFVENLADIFDYVTPCFPEKYRIFKVIFKEYHQHLSYMLDCMGACAEQLANSDILKVIHWTNNYQETLRELGLEDDDIMFPEGPDRGTTVLIDKYIKRMRTTLHAWFVNILEADLSGEPKQKEDGQLWTPGAVDFFRIVNEQVSVVEEASNGEMLLRTGESVMTIMRQFQEAQKQYLERDLSEGLLCAVINNNTRCYNESTEFADHLDDALAAPYKGRLDIEHQCRGFLELAKEAVGHLVNAIFADTAFAELFHKLYCSEEWQSGVTTQSILATLGDYFEDYETLIEPSWFKRLAVACLEETLAHFIAALLTYTKSITDAFLKQLQRDYDLICDFFEKHCIKEKVTKVCQPLDDLRDVASSDSVDTFVLSYTSLLQSAPGITPALLERIVASRPDLTKADIKEVIDQCRDVHATRQRNLSEDPGSLPKTATKAAGGKDWSAFRVALVAAKRKSKPSSSRI
ncbi:Exocyst complex component 3 [Coccomyxa sp. Obi]|nr:Exocyst complex component 3 [Coccomyxa sp. Obi]